jgi:hypothetical protein
MLRQMQCLAVHRDQQLRTGPGDHVAQFVAARMAGDMDEMGAIGNDLDPLGHEAVDDPAHRLFVAGDGARGKDHAVAAVQRHVGMIVVGDARQRRTLLTLASRAQGQHLVRRKMAVVIGATEILHAIEVPGLACHLGDALHRTPNHDDFAIGGLRGIGDGPDTSDIGREGGHGHASFRRLHQLGDGLCHLGFRGRTPLAHGIGGIADQRQQAGITQLAQPPFIGRQADDRGRVDLPVPGMQHRADLGVNRKRMRFRNRMRDRDELDIERADINPATGRNHGDGNLGRVALGLAFGAE